MADTSPYSSVLPLASSLPTWINKEDAERIAAYKVYDDMYNNYPDTYALMLRGTDDLPIYVPTAKSVVNTMGRYVGRDFGFTVDPTKGTAQEQEEVIAVVQEFFDREDLISKFNMAKKENMKFGDVFWFLSADSEKPEGARISLKTVDPALVQKLFDQDDPDKVVGYQMVEQINNGDTVVIQRQRWLKNTSLLHPNYGDYEAPVVYDKVKLEVEGWESDEPKIVESVVPATYFPDGITQLPFYHWKNNPETGNPYGNSELKSIERLIAGINQAITDEDLALAIAGLGVYKSDSGGPVDADGRESDWVIGPGRVVEDESFDRVQGVSSVQPVLEHVRYLHEKIDETVGITDVVRGKVEASTAESGIALSIRMSPTIDAADEKDDHILGVMNQMLHDLGLWFEAIEGVSFGEVVVKAAFGTKMPTNRTAELKELYELHAAKIISTQYFQQQLTERFGFKFPEDMNEQIAQDTANAAAAADPYAARMAEEGAEEAPPEE